MCDHGYIFSLQKHKFECALNLVECSNEACNEMVPREELRKHLEEECQHRQIRCRHCGINITVANERVSLVNVFLIKFLDAHVMT